MAKRLPLSAPPHPERGIMLRTFQIYLSRERNLSKAQTTLTSPVRPGITSYRVQVEGSKQMPCQWRKERTTTFARFKRLEPVTCQMPKRFQINCGTSVHDSIPSEVAKSVVSQLRCSVKGSADCHRSGWNGSRPLRRKERLVVHPIPQLKRVQIMQIGR